MKHNKIYFLFLIFAICFYSCTSEDIATVLEQEPEGIEENEDGPMATLEENRAASVAVLTNDTANGKVWRIATAELENANGAFDIASNFNTRDDEFIFRNSPSTTARDPSGFELILEWRQNSAIALNADSNETAITESYKLPEIFTIDFEIESGSTLTDEDNKFELTIAADGTITVILRLENTTITITLTEKLETDYETVPTGPLNFDTVFTIESNGIAGNSPDMVGSLANNSIYIGTREDDLGDPGQTKPERVIKYDRNTGTLSEKLSFQSDFVSKQLIVNDNKLLVVGAKGVNTYNLDILDEPTRQNYLDFDDSIGLTRFGTAVADDTVYLVGGNILFPSLADHIYKFDISTGAISQFAVMPEKRYGARAEIVNDKLYIFGGTETFSAPPAENTIYVYDLHTAELTIETMPTNVDVTFTGKLGRLIYVAGSIMIREGDTVIDENPYMAVYDTDSGTYTELETNLISWEKETIHAMAIFGDKMFILYGQKLAVQDGRLQEWTIRAADI